MDTPDGYEFRIKSMEKYLMDWVINTDFAPSEIAREAGITQAVVTGIIKKRTWNPRIKTLIGFGRAHDVLCERQRAYDEQQNNGETNT